MPRDSEGIYIVDSPKRNPKGCKESSRWSESAETTGNAILIGVAPRRGARSLDVKIIKGMHGVPEIVGGVEDHVHILASPEASALHCGCTSRFEEGVVHVG